MTSTIEVKKANSVKSVVMVQVNPTMERLSVRKPPHIDGDAIFLCLLCLLCLL